MVNETGPYLVVAALCEKVLQEASGVLSLIRIVDRMTISTQGVGAPEEMPPGTVSITAVISLKSGQARGSDSVMIRLERPSGVKTQIGTFPVFFEGEDRGSNIIFDLALFVEEQGLYWFDVLIGDRLLTRMPLRIVYQRLTVGP